MIWHAAIKKYQTIKKYNCALDNILAKYSVNIHEIITIKIIHIFVKNRYFLFSNFKLMYSRYIYVVLINTESGNHCTL